MENGEKKKIVVDICYRATCYLFNILPPPPHIKNKKRNQGKKQQELHNNPDPPWKNFD
jgi:hypothetical protein